MTDPAKLAAWFGAYAPALVLYARQWLERGQAEDVVQEVFVRLFAQSREPPNVRAWLYAAVRNASISEMRSLLRRRQRERTVVARSPNWFDPRPGDAMDADAVQEAVQALPPRQREIVFLRVWSGMTLSEVSQVTGLPISTIHDEYGRGLAGIRQMMETPCTTQSQAKS